MENNNGTVRTAVLPSPAEMVDLDIVEGLDDLTGCGLEVAARLLQVAELVGMLTAAVNTWEEVLQAAESESRCCGKVYWRDSEVMYLNHAAGVDCPYCGDRNGRSRIRRYVGVDSHAQADAEEAIQNWGMWLAAQKTLKAVKRELAAALSQLEVVGAKQRRLI